MSNVSYRKLAISPPKTEKHGKCRFLSIPPKTLELLSAAAFHDIQFHLRKTHLDMLARILKDSSASANDRFVAAALIENAMISAEGELPMCQDTGVANVIAFKGENVLTGLNDAASISRGIVKTWQTDNLRYSVMAPLTMTKEANTNDNLPAQIDIYSAKGDEYRFLFIAKGGGSSNRTSLYQESPGILEEKRLADFLADKLRKIGVAACPPYHLAVVIGGLSPEMTLKTVKLASAGYLDDLPGKGTTGGAAFRDKKWEKIICKLAEDSGLGAQFGGKHFALEARVIRLPRHAASCPIGIGVSCSADRNIKAKITAKGVFLEKLEKDLSAYLPLLRRCPEELTRKIDLDQPMQSVCKQLSECSPGARVSLNGTLIVARDLAHARLHARLMAGKGLPEYMKKHPVFYAGPAKTPKAMASGSFGPTTALRMDMYSRDFMKNGASLITLAKGQRSKSFAETCSKYGGFYLGTIGGAAALVAQKNITSSEIIDFEDLEMEAVRKIVVKDLPAFLICNNKGKSLYD